MCTLRGLTHRLGPKSWIRFFCSRDSFRWIEPNSSNLIIARAKSLSALFLFRQHKVCIEVLTRELLFFFFFVGVKVPVRNANTFLSFITKSVSACDTQGIIAFFTPVPLYLSPFSEILSIQLSRDLPSNCVYHYSYDLSFLHKSICILVSLYFFMTTNEWQLPGSQGIFRSFVDSPKQVLNLLWHC